MKLNFSKALSSVKDHLINVPGWRTNRKIVVFESDDWGEIRMPDNKSIDILRKNGVFVDRCHYMLNDALASNIDLENLFEVLTDLKDFKGNHPIFTANVIMANPDFNKIKASGFSQYYFEHFTESLARYPQHDKAFSLWKIGMNTGIFHPQFHGREHVHIARWMRDLRLNVKETRVGFDLGLFGISGHTISQERGSYLAAFDDLDGEQPDNRSGILKEGLDMFHETFEYRSISFIPPNYIWNDKVEQVAFENGVRFFQGANVQRYSSNYGEERKILRHNLGSSSACGQTYLSRNCTFEPSSAPDKDWVDQCLSKIKIAFRMRKPAVIDTHRVNYVGYINENNRDHNLRSLKTLLKRIIMAWPDVEFLSTPELAKMVAPNA